MLFAPEILDSVTDVVYFGTLEHLNILVHPAEYVIWVMGLFLLLAIIKDFWAAYSVVQIYHWYIEQKELRPHANDKTVNKVEKLALSAVLEDIAQVYMQYFFFEKYMLKD